MIRVAQSGILLGALGMMITFVGLFPGVIAIPPTPGFGIGQILTVTIGLATLILGALVYVKFKFFARKNLTLTQQIAIRISYTGLTFAALVAMADVLGFGSNLRSGGEDEFLGPIQLTGILINFGVAAVGVILFALAGDPEVIEE
ncbi:MAG: hypothetical protein AAF787_03440 [Chloroflexota bacterium]